MSSKKSAKSTKSTKSSKPAKTAKTAKSEKLSEKANEKANEKEYVESEPDDDIDLPELKYVSETTKERYEYNPVLRAEIVYVHPENRITSEVMSKFELCEVRSHRAKQIESGLLAFVDVGELTDPLAIANKEIREKRCPLDIVRVISNHGKIIAEKWHVNEMAIPDDM